MGSQQRDRMSLSEMSDVACALIFTVVATLLFPVIWLFFMFYREDPADSYKHRNF